MCEFQIVDLHCGYLDTDLKEGDYCYYPNDMTGTRYYGKELRYKFPNAMFIHISEDRKFYRILYHPEENLITKVKYSELVQFSV